MKLRNKKTGEIIDLEKGHICETIDGESLRLRPNIEMGKSYTYSSLAEFYEHWEDYKGPKELWSIDQFGEPINVTGLSSLQLEKLRRIGNLFESEERTEKAIEKLKAWTRLEDNGFRFTFLGWALPTTPPLKSWIEYEIEPPKGCLDKETREDLDLLFGGKK